VQGFGAQQPLSIWLKWVQSYRYNRQRWRFNKRKRLYFWRNKSVVPCERWQHISCRKHDSFEEINQNMDNRCRNFHLALHQD
jgi:hypothetical protein